MDFSTVSTWLFIYFYVNTEQVTSSVIQAKSILKSWEYSRVVEQALEALGPITWTKENYWSQDKPLRFWANLIPGETLNEKKYREQNSDSPSDRKNQEFVQLYQIPQHLRPNLNFFFPVCFVFSFFLNTGSLCVALVDLKLVYQAGLKFTDTHLSLFPKCSKKEANKFNK